MARRPVVWLLRAGEKPDPYEAALDDAGFDARSVSVLEFEFVNEVELRSALEHPRRYGGLIFTSPRAVAAFAEAISWLPSENVLWHSRDIFAVGPRTAAELRKIGFEPGGEESGSGSRLAEHILRADIEKPLLFLCGDRRRDELPDRLQSKGVSVEEICVYRTLPKTEIAASGMPDPDWVVFFSPSGLEAAASTSEVAPSERRLCAIGPTTASALEKAGYTVDAIADEPSPAGVVRALMAAVED